MHPTYMSLGHWSLDSETVVMNPIDAEAADYIVSLWGRKRRAYARRYWMFLSRGTERPLMGEVFASERIEEHLNKIGRNFFLFRDE